MTLLLVHTCLLTNDPAVSVHTSTMGAHHLSGQSPPSLGTSLALRPPLAQAKPCLPVTPSPTLHGSCLTSKVTKSRGIKSALPEETAVPETLTYSHLTTSPLVQQGKEPHFKEERTPLRGRCPDGRRVFHASAVQCPLSRPSVPWFRGHMTLV